MDYDPSYHIDGEFTALDNLVNFLEVTQVPYIWVILPLLVRQAFSTSISWIEIIDPKLKKLDKLQDSFL